MSMGLSATAPVVTENRAAVWHIVTGEYPSQPGGVSDYVYLLARGLAEAGDYVHVWTSAHGASIPTLDHVEVHPLQGRFGFRWLMDLHRGIRSYPERSTVLVQYVPHMYGWKAMNIGLCCWLAIERDLNVWVMFHEVAFPFKRGQPWKHNLLALVQRAMAWSILRSVKKSFTSTDRYLQLLRRLGPREGPVRLLRIFSNVPTPVSSNNNVTARCEALSGCRHIVGMFSSFGGETCELLEPVLPKLLENRDLGILLIGPGGALAQTCAAGFSGRVHATGRLNALQLGPYFQVCDVLLQLYPGGVSAARGTFMAALSSGVPMVTNAGEETEPLFRDSGAMSFTENTPESIQLTVESLLADPAAARKLGNRGRRLYEQHFACSRTIDALHEALEGDGSPADQAVSGGTARALRS